MDALGSNSRRCKQPSNAAGAGARAGMQHMHGANSPPLEGVYRSDESHRDSAALLGMTVHDAQEVLMGPFATFRSWPPSHQALVLPAG